MHELSIALALVEQVRRIAEKESATRIVSIRLRVGALSGVDAEALSFCFPMAARESMAEGAQLIIDSEPLRWLCLACQQLFTLDNNQPDQLCPHCGAPDHHLTGSDDLILESVEMS
ncbi:MAG: hydrogenase maturation nickel metallochaperone HypA [Magnetococcus sp. YQC-9]